VRPEGLGQLKEEISDLKIIPSIYFPDRLCGLVVRVLGYRSGGPGSIPGTTRFSGKKKKENK
jgi:hypothetical protein